MGFIARQQKEGTMSQIPTERQCTPWQCAMLDALSAPNSMFSMAPSEIVKAIPVVADVFSKLGATEMIVDDAVAALRLASDEVEQEAVSIRTSNTPDPDGRYGMLAVVMGQLRTAAAKCWDMDSRMRLG